eukprot:TRINITY_DN69276_c0_g1_i1.p1 TRINITY_DN69276_c0_g1~~TRINITY_DN69276_c0_g1_i1.p1  ORF type:complete len:251 (+),score=30.33 TRINITY_DN69276_c0_g1_i1:35-787(+)
MSTQRTGKTERSHQPKQKHAGAQHTTAQTVKLQELIECSNSILLVGEGDFSFAAAVVLFILPEARRQEVHLVATTFEASRETFTSKGMQYRATLDNIDIVLSSGSEVMFGVDCTALATSTLANQQFDLVIFNFPHLGVPRTQADFVPAHRQLLQQFLHQCVDGNVVKVGGCVAITLKDLPMYDEWLVDPCFDVSGCHLIGCDGVNLDSGGAYNFETEAFPTYKHVNTACDANTAVNEAKTHTFLRKKPPC